MKSTGEVMGIDTDFGSAFAKAQLAARQRLPLKGTVFISVQDRDKSAVADLAQRFVDLGFGIISTRGTADFLMARGITASFIYKVSTGRPHVVDAIKNREIQMVVNTGSGDETKRDGYEIRRAALKFNLPYATTVAGAKAMCEGVAALKGKRLEVMSLQEYHQQLAIQTGRRKATD
jgi:carbamoyl-phosphate synthase large subunit